ncbi:MAG: EAL domain-containing protein [Alphaproteobacteria bacterium]|nr:EAL domain-containing protein [Alphaproteobacteria bacterium]
MAFLAHYFSTLVYLAIGYAVAFVLHQHVPDFDAYLAYAFGGLTSLLLLLLHTLRALGAARRQFRREIEKLRDELYDAEDEMEGACKEVRRIREAISVASKEKVVQAADGQGLDDVIAEVKVLQDLIGQLSAAPAASAAPAIAAAPPGATATPPPQAAGGEARKEPMPLPKNAKTEATDQTPIPSALPQAANDLDESGILSVVQDGLKADRVELVLQPVVRLPQRKRRYFECYSRIDDGAGRVVLPEQYLEVARKAGLIAPIDNMLLFRCVQLIRRVRKAQQDVGFFCNISSHSLADTPFLRDFIAFMAENVELAPNLVFEFAQADVAEMTEDVAYNLQRLADLGFRFSIDQVTALNMDYGELARYFFRFVKVDAAILLRMIRSETDGSEPPVAAGDMRLKDFKAQLDRAGMDLIVEKVEQERDLVELLDYNIDYGQGYLFGEPRPAKSAA